MYLYVLAFLCFLSCSFTQETQEGGRDRVPDKEGRELMSSPSKNHPNQSSQRRQRNRTPSKEQRRLMSSPSQSSSSQSSSSQNSPSHSSQRGQRGREQLTVKWRPRYEQNTSTTEALVTLLVAISTSHVFESVLLDYRTCSVLRSNSN